VSRECVRYDLDAEKTFRALEGAENERGNGASRRWQDGLIVLAAVAVFVWFARLARIPRLALRAPFAIVLTILLVVILVSCGWMLWKKTRFA
jgi:hypothetical protein